MKHQYFAIYYRADGMASWLGPFSEIDELKKAVPDNHTGMMIATPLLAMTPMERTEASPIMGPRKGADQR